MSRPLERDAVLAGYTYKLKWPDSEHAIYVTINDIERAPAGGGPEKGLVGGGSQSGGPQSGGPRRRPFEIFINTKNLEHYAWTVALTRMISAVFRRGGDVTFVAEELKAVFDPQGGRWIGGRYVPSLLAAIGDVIEEHMVRIGFITREAAPEPPLAPGSGGQPEVDVVSAAASSGMRRQAARHCPRCSSLDFVRQEGCWVCRSCGFSRCG
jgi:ribonucleoside-diphosphate reductase alpha chain